MTFRVITRQGTRQPDDLRSVVQKTLFQIIRLLRVLFHFSIHSLRSKLEVRRSKFDVHGALATLIAIGSVASKRWVMVRSKVNG